MCAYDGFPIYALAPQLIAPFTPIHELKTKAPLIFLSKQVKY